MKCFIKTIVATIENWRGLIDFGAYTSGHEYKEEKDGSLTCMICGNKS